MFSVHGFNDSIFCYHRQKPFNQELHNAIDTRVRLPLSRKSTGRKLPFYEMTKDGFMFLVMGCKQAAKFKEANINCFNQMEADLHTPPATPKPDNTAALFTDMFDRALADRQTSHQPIPPEPKPEPRETLAQPYLLIVENGKLMPPLALPYNVALATSENIKDLVADMLPGYKLVPCNEADREVGRGSHAWFQQQIDELGPKP
ncbi:Rha family transcriptional regulator [Salinisphaera sp. G21_0]|nr:Rha family transcriptional regulator [Salinisphaera sp. G21_0]